MNEIIKNKDDLKKFLEIERKKYNRKSIKMPIICIVESDFLWKHNVLLRKTEYHINKKHRMRGLIYKVLLNRFQNKYNLHIPINSFGAGLKIMHLGPILVNSKVKCGKNIALHINTSIVAGGVDNGVPQLGDGIVVGVGAVILGSVNIANNIAIGANSVVNKSFYEENIAIAGVPAKKISNNGRLEWNKK